MRFPLLAALILSVTFLTGGCTTSAKQQLLDTRKGFNVALAGINVAHAAGAVTIAQKQALQPYVLATQSALDAGDAEVRQAQAATAAGDTSTASTLMKNAKAYAAAAIAGMQKLSEAQVKAGAVASPPPAK